MRLGFVSILVCVFAYQLCFAQIKEVKHIIIFGIDALSIDGLQTARTPNLDFIMNNGAYSVHSRGVMPTVSAPNWASLLMGAGPEQHGITSNEWDPADPPFPAVTGKGKLFPSIVSILKEQQPASITAALFDWDKFQVMLPKEDLDFSLLTKTQSETITTGIDYFLSIKPTLTFLYMTFVDDAGHHYGHGTREYYSAITQADSLLGLILQAIKKNRLDDSTLIIVVSDHGGVQKGHGGESLAEIEVPMFIYGTGVCRGKEIKEPVNNYDCAATIAYILGLKQPDAWLGKPIKSIFLNSGNSQINSKNLVKTPQIFPKGGLYLNESSPIEIFSYSKDAQIYYTTDGSEPTEKSILYTSPIILNKSCLLKTKAISDSGAGSRIVSGSFRIVNDADKPEINYYYYEGVWEQLPDFSLLTPIDSGKVFEFSLDSIRHRTDHFAIKYNALIEIRKEGLYKFTCISDDGAQLWIDDTLVVDNDGSHSVSEKTGKLSLTKGMHSFELIYFDDTESEFLELQFESFETDKQTFSPQINQENPLLLIIPPKK